MEREKEILNEVEKTLNSFDDDIVLKENPFLFTRIRSGMQDKSEKVKKESLFHLGLNKAILILVLLVNIITLVYYYNEGSKSNLQEQMAAQLENDFKIEQSQNIY